jgi:DNA-directed RNA polymerase
MEEPEPNQNSRVKRQHEMEADAVERGVARYKAILKSRGLETKFGRQFLRLYFQTMTQTIRQEAERARKAKRAKKYTLPLLSLDEDKLAFITLQCIFNIAFLEEEELESVQTLGAKKTLLGREIGQRCWLELCFDRAAQRERNVFEAIKKKYPPHVADRIARRLVGKFVSEEWSEKNYDLHLGELLIELAEENGLIKGEEKRCRNKTIRFMRLSDEAEQWLEKLSGRYEALAYPMYSPMVVSPRPWQGLNDGGYLTNSETHALQLVKHKTWNKNQVLKAFDGVDPETITAAVNALQSTAWRINRPIYGVLKLMMELRKTLPGFYPTKKAPSKLPWEQRDHPEYEKRKVEYETISSRNRKARRYRHIIIPMRMKACEELLGLAEDFFFPYQLDFRGRVYPLPQVFHPQADDLGRALIKFAEGKALGQEGDYWLKVHLANTYGKDKESFGDRVKWVEANEENILEAAKNPLACTWWRKKEVDKPWCFLAACFEWEEYSRKGKDFKSHLPVSMDGTCNGLQHLSAMGRDEDGGRATNLLDLEKPADIYQEVADRLYSIVEADCQNGVVRAVDWWNNGKQFLKHGKIDRKLAKHATMTTPYGVTRDGIAEQLRVDGFTEGLDMPWNGSLYLARKLEEAISNVVKKAEGIMLWLKNEVAEKLGRKNQGCSWITPTGFPVVQEYRKPRQVRARIKKHRYTIYRENPKGRVRVGKQKKTIVANFVHSMDAAHMMLTVNESYKKGLLSFAMIHDSFGVHACHIPELNTLLREQFVQMYQEPVLEYFFTRTCSVTGVKLEEPPPLGDLHVEKVLQSKYFFC